MEGIWLYLLAVKGVILLAGGAIIYYTIRAARRTNDRGLWLLAGGLVIAGAGILAVGWLPTLVSLDALTSLALTSTLTAIGFVLIVVSMSTESSVPR